MNAKETIENFYSSLNRKDDGWQRDLAPNVKFSDASGKLNAEGKEAFIRSFTSFLRGVERVQLKQLILQGSDGAAVVGYDYISPKGNRMHQDDAEVWRIQDGMIAALTIYFDITEFRSFMAN